MEIYLSEDNKKILKKVTNESLKCYVVDTYKIMQNMGLQTSKLTDIKSYLLNKEIEKKILTGLKNKKNDCIFYKVNIVDEMLVNSLNNFLDKNNQNVDIYYISKNYFMDINEYINLEN